MLRFVKKRLLEAVCYVPTNALRCIFYRFCGIVIGKETHIARKAKIQPGNIFGDSVRIESDAFI